MNVRRFMLRGARPDSETRSIPITYIESTLILLESESVDTIEYIDQKGNSRESEVLTGTTTFTFALLMAHSFHHTTASTRYVQRSSTTTVRQSEYRCSNPRAPPKSY